MAGRAPDRLPTNLVPHPRYGTTVHRSGEGRYEREIRRSFYLLKEAVLFPQSAISADISKQHFTVAPRRFYVDLLEICRGCGRPFLFYALEQKHWFEELEFFVDTRCVACPECRASDRKLRNALKRYGEAVGRRDLDHAALKRLLGDAALLVEMGAVRNVAKLAWARSQAKKRPGLEAERDRLEAAIATRRADH